MTKKKKPLTREDVLKLIEEHGAPEGLDLAGSDLDGIDLSSLDLHGIILTEAHLIDANLQEARVWGANLQGANLRFANLQGADLVRANLQGATLLHANLQGATLLHANLQGATLLHVNLQGADLTGADLQGADLTGADLQEAYLDVANLQGANLDVANLQGADLDVADLQGATLLHANLQGADLKGAKLSGATLRGAKISRETRLEDVNWGPMPVFREKFILGEEEAKEFEDARQVYRVLKQWHTDHGIYDIAGRFYYREMEATRKARSWTREPILKLWSSVLGLLCGYGERPEFLVAWALTLVFGLAAAYHFSGALAPESYLNSLYYSAVSFTALGYGKWAPTPEGWAKGAGAGEAFIGVFMIALFLVTFTRRMIR